MCWLLFVKPTVVHVIASTGKIDQATGLANIVAVSAVLSTVSAGISANAAVVSTWTANVIIYAAGRPAHHVAIRV